ncbi:hypothetical protein [Streptomyces sp. LN785]|uniref:hypothetical protein n=1 Tax=Streptomyces sp. LN785 TaxID=3112983 RepID=UPI00371C4040
MENLVFSYRIVTIGDRPTGGPTPGGSRVPAETVGPLALEGMAASHSRHTSARATTPSPQDMAAKYGTEN